MQSGLVDERLYATLTRLIGRGDDEFVEVVLLDHRGHRVETVLTEQFRTGDDVDVSDAVTHPFEVDVTRPTARADECADVHQSCYVVPSLKDLPDRTRTGHGTRGSARRDVIRRNRPRHLC